MCISVSEVLKNGIYLFHTHYTVFKLWAVVNSKGHYGFPQVIKIDGMCMMLHY